jgi:hypothetical protein
MSHLYLLHPHLRHVYSIEVSLPFYENKLAVSIDTDTPNPSGRPVGNESLRNTTSFQLMCYNKHRQEPLAQSRTLERDIHAIQNIRDYHDNKCVALQSQISILL